MIVAGRVDRSYREVERTNAGHDTYNTTHVGLNLYSLRISRCSCPVVICRKFQSHRSSFFNRYGFVLVVHFDGLLIDDKTGAESRPNCSMRIGISVALPI